MTSVGRLAIAIAALVGLSPSGWGQDLGPASGQRPGFASAAPATTAGAAGAWIGDDAPTAASPAMFNPTLLNTGPATQSQGSPIYGGQTFGATGSSPIYGGQPADAMEHGDAESGYLACDDGDGTPGVDDGMPRYPWGDLWVEVHSHRRIWVQQQYVSAWTKGNPLPPLVTTSPLGTPQTQAGVLPASANTEILFGNDLVGTQTRNGGRIDFGYWLVDGEFVGIEGHYFALGGGSANFNRFSDFSNFPNQPADTIILARPFFNVDPAGPPGGVQDASLLAFPNFITPQGQTVQLSGGVDVETRSNVQSAGALMRNLVWIDFTQNRRLDFIYGYRFFRVDDSVTIADTIIRTGGGLPMLALTGIDQFQAKNVFHGGELGLKGQFHRKRLSLEIIAKCAFGDNQQVVNINGSTTIVTAGTTSTTAGSLLALPSNIGKHERNVFAVVPEGDVNFGVDVFRNLKWTFGYTFMYMNKVQRSGSAIDLTVNPTQIGGGTLIGDARPAFVAHDTPFWLHGATTGIEYRW